MAGFDGTRGWIHHLAVSVECRLQGVGTALMAAADFVSSDAPRSICNYGRTTKP